MNYIRQLEQQPPAQVGKASACFLCDAAASDANDAAIAREKLILQSDPRGLLMLNKFPYTNGHLLAAPHAHVGSLSDLDAEARAGLMELTELAERLITRAMNPQGMNIGINLGRCAGAGLPGHIHVHILPRWNGDTNFMQTVGEVRVMPQAMDETYEALSAALAEL